MKFETEVIIKESLLDSFGHVNNAAYLTILEEVRWDLITRNGYGLKVVHEKKKAPIILEVNLKFRRELRVREKVRVTFELTKMSKKIGEVVQEIFNEKGELCTLATFRMGFFDLETRTLITPTPEWLKAIGAEGVS